MDSCYQKGVVNCTKESCDQDYECCQQGGKCTLGLCIRKDCGCNEQTGLSKIKSKIRETFGQTESYVEGSREGYSETDSSCTDWRNAFLVMLGIIVVLVYFSVSMYLKSSRSR